METLGLADSTPRSDNRLKSLFWPSIENGTDVDYLGTQGYWVCTVISIFSLVMLILANQPIIAAATFLLYYLGGVGVRERSRYAAAVIFAMYLVDTIIMPFSVVRIILTALLLSNLRGTWIASTWKPESEEAILPPRLNETFFDKLADQLPAWLWPKLRIVYYIYSAGFMLLLIVGLLAMAMRLKA